MNRRIPICSIMLAGAMLTSCMADEGVGSLGMVVSAASSTCSGSAGTAPLASIDQLRIQVGSVTSTADAPAFFDDVINVVEGAADVDSIAAGSDRVVTVLGCVDGQDAPAWYGRARDVTIVQGRAAEVEMVLTRFNAFTCVSEQTTTENPTQRFTHRVFSSAVTMGDGRVFVSGGFAGKRDLDGGVSQFELNAPSKEAFIYDPITGVYQYAGDMNVARAGHSTVYVTLDGRDKVLIFGGTTKASMKTGDTFPFSIDSANSLNSFEIYDVKDGTFEIPKYQDGTVETMRLPRAFFTAARMADNSVLISGGGKWPSDDADYRFAEIWAPSADEGHGGMLELGDSMPMNAQHNGAAVVKLDETSRGLTRYLIVGGTTNTESNIEIFTQSSKQDEGVGGAFRPRFDTAFPLVYFPTVVRIADDPLDTAIHKRFLVVGGSRVVKGVLQSSPLSSDSKVKMAYVLKVYDDGIAVTPIYGDCGGRFMGGAAASFDRAAVSVFGGFTDNSGVSDAKTCVFDVATLSFSEVGAGGEQFLSRVGFSMVTLPDDTLFIAGGIISADTLGVDGPGMSEIYTPSILWTGSSCNGGDR